ncbi:hypothetical protein, partial [Halioxenophilus sp. WMMB6]|uniref:hypothetical protein n=1 Tax=Halioxenophilus sp. WMMB6 TaxID=3073815 RepID=UPI00295E53D3
NQACFGSLSCITIAGMFSKYLRYLAGPPYALLQSAHAAGVRTFLSRLFWANGKLAVAGKYLSVQSE